MRQLFWKFHFLSRPPLSMQRLLDVAVLNLVLDLSSFLLFVGLVLESLVTKFLLIVCSHYHEFHTRM